MFPSLSLQGGFADILDMECERIVGSKDDGGSELSCWKVILFTKCGRTRCGERFGGESRVPVIYCR